MRKITIWLDENEISILLKIKNREKKTYKEIIEEYIKMKQRNIVKNNMIENNEF